jgi:hypothetical protein
MEAIMALPAINTICTSLAQYVVLVTATYAVASSGPVFNGVVHDAAVLRNG